MIAPRNPAQTAAINVDGVKRGAKRDAALAIPEDVTLARKDDPLCIRGPGRAEILHEEARHREARDGRRRTGCSKDYDQQRINGGQLTHRSHTNFFFFKQKTAYEVST